jgi:DNA adenine methylase
MKERRKYPTVLRYPGGKSRIIYYLFRENMIPENVQEYREGFLGGGSCALAFSVMYPDVPVWVNDLYYNLFIFWKQLQRNPDLLINRLLELKDEACNASGTEELEKKHRKLYTDMRDLINTTDDHLDIATSFYILNRSSFGGFTEQNKNAFIRDSYKNTIFSQSKIRKLANISEIIQPWRITNDHYKELMRAPGDDVFVFLDPPYLIKDMLYGKNKEMHTGFSHEEFVSECKGSNHNWMITYNEHEWLREQFADYHMENFEFRYSLAHREENGNKKEELLIMNYDLLRDVPNPLEVVLYG